MQDSVKPDTEGYWRFLADTHAREIANAETYDKSLLTLSSAFLGVSLTLVDHVVPIKSAQCIWVLVAAWIGFSLTIIAVLGSIIYGQHCLGRLANSAKTFFIDRDSGANDLSIQINKRVYRLNVFNGLIFFMSVLLLVCFVTINIT